MVLTPSTSEDEEVKIWKEPDPTRQVIISCDPGLGRQTGRRRDSSAIHVWFRLPGKMLEQAAQVISYATAYRVGIVVAQLARWYGFSRFDGETETMQSIINIERNAHDLPHHALPMDPHIPTSACFIPQNQRALIVKGVPPSFYTYKGNANERMLLNQLVSYFERDALLIRDEGTLMEIASIAAHHRTGRIDTNGLDRAVSVIMAVDCDFQLAPAVNIQPEEEPEEEAPFGSVRFARRQRVMTGDEDESILTR